MVDITDLITESIPGNYFAPHTYLQGDFESGLIENRQGGRLLAIPETLLRGLYEGLNTELGSATGVVLYNCGRKWGKNFFRRFSDELNSHYRHSLAELPMIELIQCLKQCWKAHGWGLIEPDFQHYQQGFLVIKVTHSYFAQAIADPQKPSCFIEAGLLGAFFSELATSELHCVQTACESMGADANLFILGLAKRLQPAEKMVEQGQTHTAIMQTLTANQQPLR
ncbi:MAG: V4R domain-containing protein [Cyanobacteria bacterium J06623_7]